MADPQAAADHLMTTAEVYGVVTATGRRSSSGGATFEFTLRPLPALEAVGYPTERIRIALLPDDRVHAYVLDGRDRPFKHRRRAATCAWSIDATTWRCAGCRMTGRRVLARRRDRVLAHRQPRSPARPTPATARSAG